ncbi:MAG: hypothetical protein ACOY93_07805 [Bacillota bacterium]
MRESPSPGRFPLLGFAIFTLLAALWAGLLRMGWSLPPLTPTLSGGHGPLMVSGFLGTLIGLERAVALNRRWMYLAPALTALGAITIIAGLPAWVGALTITLGSALLVLLFAQLVRLQPALFTYVLALGAVVWLGGNLLWLFGLPISTLAPWWAGFLILTIAGERLELSRLLRISRRGVAAFAVAVGLFLAGLLLVPFAYGPGWRVTGAGMVAVAVWLLTHDVAWRTIRQAGLTRFIATCMLSGYLWLLAAGGLAMGYGFLFGGPYDAVLHAIFLGFVFSMIFGHAPVIFPAVLGVTMRFTPRFYAHLLLLHLSLLLRVGSGLTETLLLRQWSALLNVIALLLFLAQTVTSIQRKGAG